MRESISGRKVLACATALALGLLAACAPVSESPVATVTADRPSVELGVFRGADPADIEPFVEWFGHRPTIAVTFADGGSDWATLAGPERMEPWTGSPYQVIYSIPMLPAEPKNVSLKKGARGDYDRHFAKLGENLIAAGLNDAILRVGWEFNIRTSPWHAKNPADYAAFWQRIVRVMRNVEGQEFTFNWNPLSGEFTDSNTVEYYPGDDFVDHVGIDVYDVSWNLGIYPFPETCSDKCVTDRRDDNWFDLLRSPHGLRFWADFAAEHGKPLSIPEWGVWDRLDRRGGGDNPDFVRRMHTFINTPGNNVAYQAYFDYDNVGVGTHRLTDLPEAGHSYRTHFGQDYPK